MEKGEKVSKIFTFYYSVEAIQHGKSFIEMQLIDPIDIFQGDYNILRDRFKTDSVNIMKNKLLVAKKQRKFQYILAWLNPLRKP